MAIAKFEPFKSKRTTKKAPFYYYINHGDFDIVWNNVLIFAVAHLLMINAAYVFFTQWNYYTLIWTHTLAVIVGIGVTGGAHRLWAHKSYEATNLLKTLIMIGQTLSGQNCIHIWARDHRVHHKWSDTDGDPHNTKRGFFFAHCGWLMRKKHPEMMAKARTLDFSDLDRDPVVKFQRTHYYALYTIFSMAIPMAIPVIFWGESWWTSFLFTYVGRYVLSLHVTWFVNSAAHMYGHRPYNGKIEPVESPWVSFIAFGEGYHNYHHNFPSDYQASESGHGFNITKHFIDFMARCGLAYNLRVTSKGVVEAVRQKTMDLARFANNNNSFGHSHVEYEGVYETKDGKMGGK